MNRISGKLIAFSFVNASIDRLALTSRAWGWQPILETPILMSSFDVAMLPRGRDLFLMVLKLCISC